MLQSNEEWRQKSLVLFQRQAKLWAEAGRSNREMLFTGDALAEAETFASDHRENITEDDEAFLAASRKERGQILDAKRREDEIYDANRRLRIQRMLLSGVLVALVATGIYALWSYRGLRDQRRATQEALVASQVLALVQQAEGQGPNIDSALLLTAQAKRYADRVTEQTARSMPALSRTSREETLYTLAERLIRAEPAGAGGFGYFAHLIPDVAASAATIDASGAVLATGEKGGSVRLWRRVGSADQETGSKVLPLNDVGRMSLNKGGRWLALTAPVDENARTGGNLWVLGVSAEGRVLSAEQPGQTLVTAVAVVSSESATDPFVVTGDLLGQVRIWRKPGPKGHWEAHPLGSLNGAVSSLATGSRSATILAGANGPIGRWTGVGWSSGQATRGPDLAGHDPIFPVRSLVLTEAEDVLWSAGPVRTAESSAVGLCRWDLGGQAPPTCEPHPIGEFISGLTLVDQHTPPIAATSSRGDCCGSIRRRTRMHPAWRGQSRLTRGESWLSRAGPPVLTSCLSDGIASRAFGRRYPLPFAARREPISARGRSTRAVVLPLERTGDWAVVAVRNGIKGGLGLVRIGADGAVETDANDGCRAPDPLEIPSRWPDSRSTPISLAADPQTGLVAVGTYDGEVFLYRAVEPAAPDRPHLELVANTTTPAYSLAFVTGDCLMVGGKGGVKGLRLTGGQLASVDGVPPAVPWTEEVGFLASRAGWVAAGTGRSDSLAIWAAGKPTGAPCGLEGQKLQPSSAGEKTSTRALAFSPDGRFLSAQMENGSLRVWSADGWRELESQSAGTEGGALSFSPDGRVIASGYVNGHLRLWEVDQKSPAVRSTDGARGRVELALDLKIATRRVSAVAFTSDGTGILVAEFGSKLRVIPTILGTDAPAVHSCRAESDTRGVGRPGGQRDGLRVHLWAVRAGRGGSAVQSQRPGASGAGEMKWRHLGFRGGEP